MAHDQTIDANAVLLAVAARKVANYQRRSGEAGCRWAAMSGGARCVTRCSHRYSAPSAFPVSSMLMPMTRGNLDQSIERMRLTEGLPAIRKTFGCGLRAILAETKQAVMR